MDDSILDSIKKLLGIDASYKAFDMDITIHINSAFATLHQLAVGPDQGFLIVDKSSKWGDFVGSDMTLNNVKSYIYVYTRIRFDPPQSAAGLNSFKEMEKEYEWRLNVNGETGDLVFSKEPLWWDLSGGVDFPADAKVGDYGYDSLSDDVWRAA